MGLHVHADDSTSNTASRVLAVLRRAESEANAKKQTWLVWAETFGIEAALDQEECLAEVTSMLVLLRQQVDLLHQQMKRTPVRRTNYEGALQSVRKALVMGQLVNPWAHYKQHLDPGSVLDKLEWCVDALPSGPPESRRT